MDKNKMQATADKITKVTLTNDDLHNLILYADNCTTALQNIIFLCKSSPSINCIKKIAEDSLKGKNDTSAIAEQTTINCFKEIKDLIIFEKPTNEELLEYLDTAIDEAREILKKI